MNFKNKTIILTLLIAISLVTSCTLFELPKGECELLDVYTRDEQEYKEEYFAFGSSASQQRADKPQEVTVSYICTTVKITNTSNKNIYNSTINIQASARDRTYYKTISLDVLIAPGATIYIPVEIEKYTKQLAAVNKTNDAAWDKASIQIISFFFK